MWNFLYINVRHVLKLWPLLLSDCIRNELILLVFGVWNSKRSIPVLTPEVLHLISGGRTGWPGFACTFVLITDQFSDPGRSAGRLCVCVCLCLSVYLFACMCLCGCSYQLTIRTLSGWAYFSVSETSLWMQDVWRWCAAAMFVISVSETSLWMQDVWWW